MDGNNRTLQVDEQISYFLYRRPNFVVEGDQLLFWVMILLACNRFGPKPSGPLGLETILQPKPNSEGQGLVQRGGPKSKCLNGLLICKLYNTV